MFSVAYSRKSEKFLKISDKLIVRRIMDEIELLQKNPFPHGVRSVQGFGEKLFRIRVGDYRILYEVDHEQQAIGIVVIDKRSHAYD